MAKNESYKEIGFFRPKFKKYSRIGLDLNYLFYRLNWYAVEKFHYITNFPVHIDFETTNFCNLKCTMCPHSLDGGFGEQGIMDFDIFKKVIDEGAGEGLKSIKLNIRGEPLLHPRLADMVRYAKTKGIIEVMFNTNGLLLDKAKTKALIEAGEDLSTEELYIITFDREEIIEVNGNKIKVIPFWKWAIES